MSKHNDRESDNVVTMPKNVEDIYDKDGKPIWNKIQLFGDKCIVIPYTSPKHIGSIIVPEELRHPERRCKVVAVGPDSPVEVDDIVIIGDRDVLPIEIGKGIVLWCKPDGIIAVCK